MANGYPMSSLIVDGKSWLIQNHRSSSYAADALVNWILPFPIVNRNVCITVLRKWVGTESVFFDHLAAFCHQQFRGRLQFTNVLSLPCRQQRGKGNIMKTDGGPRRPGCMLHNIRFELPGNEFSAKKVDIGPIIMHNERCSEWGEYI